MADSKRYYSRSWSLVTKESGWIKPFLVIGAANLVPIFGLLGTGGYILEWARLVAWGSDEAPARKDIKVGSSIKSGWRGLMSCVGWAILAAVVFDFIGFNETGIIYTVVMALFAALFKVCQLRGTIYQDFKAGYQANRIFDMLKRDFGGIASIAGWTLLFETIVTVVISFVATVFLLPSMLDFFSTLVYYADDLYYNDYMSYYMVTEFFRVLSRSIPTLLVLCYVAFVASAVIDMTTSGAVALWMRQFNIPAWGKSGDPLPEPVAQLEAAPVVPQAPATPASVVQEPVTSTEPAPVVPASPATDAAPVVSAPAPMVDPVAAPIAAPAPVAAPAPAQPDELPIPGADEEADKGTSAEEVLEVVPLAVREESIETPIAAPAEPEVAVDDSIAPTADAPTENNDLL